MKIKDIFTEEMAEKIKRGEVLCVVTGVFLDEHYRIFSRCFVERVNPLHDGEIELVVEGDDDSVFLNPKEEVPYVKIENIDWGYKATDHISRKPEGKIFIRFYKAFQL